MPLRITFLCVFACRVTWVGRMTQDKADWRLDCENQQRVMLQMYRCIEAMLKFSRSLGFVVSWIWCKTRYFPSSWSVDPWLSKRNRFFSATHSLMHAKTGLKISLLTHLFEKKKKTFHHLLTHLLFYRYGNFSWTSGISFQLFVQSISIAMKAGWWKHVMARAWPNIQ